MSAPQFVDRPAQEIRQPPSSGHPASLPSPASPRQVNRSGWGKLFASIAVCQSAGLVGLLLGGRTGESSWYRDLRKPSFTPPSKAFGPVWTLLYLLMGLSLHRLRSKRDQPEAKPALRAFGLQLLLNAAWTPVFFGLKSITGGLLIVTGLWGVLAATTLRAWRVSRVASLLLVPYWLWVNFAMLLNAAILVLNRGRSSSPRAGTTG